MRLKDIKLSGFKSFVDPTHIATPGQLVGIVGPNGCGKSNVIDAVRWVLGESKASALRGVSMQDVIFNGAGDRKPVGRASVELVFDNSMGRAGGQWARYGELAIRRTLQRDGESTYSINGQVVRRRDITDVFLGTGLGPRAYAIIEQGMISRVIEARPEDLRVFLEEAAGVSKYKERRRETEHRLADARENLARVEDIRAELGAQLEKLEAQAAVAGQYRELEQRLAKAQQLLWFARKQDAARQADRVSADIAQSTAALEGLQARLTENEARLERLRAAHYEASDRLHAAQGEYYSVNTEVSRLEQQLGFQRDTRERIGAQIEQIERELAAVDAQAQAAREERERQGAHAAELAERVESSRADEQAAREALAPLEAELAQASRSLAEIEQTLAAAEQAVRVAETHRGHADRALSQLASRRQRLETEREELVAPVTEQVAAVTEQLEQEQAELAQVQARVAALQGEIPGREATFASARERAQVASQRLTEAQARLAALEALQARLEAGPDRREWLAQHGLSESSHLWQRISVQAGWEDALEAVLRERVNAIETPEARSAAGWTSTPARLVAFSAGTSGVPAAGHDAELEPLVRRIAFKDGATQAALCEWLHGVRCAPDLPAALEARDRLGTGESLVTPAGHLVTAHSVTFFSPDAELHGVLARQREIEALQAGLGGIEQEAARASEDLAESERALRASQSALQSEQAAAASQTRRAHDLELELAQLRQAAEAAQRRHAQIAAEIAEIADQEASEAAARRQTEAGLAQSNLERERALAERERRRGLRNEAEVALARGRERVREAERATQEAGFAERSARERLAENERRQAALAEQAARLRAQGEQLAAERAGIEVEPLAESMQAQLELRQARETALAATRDALEELTAELKAGEEERLAIEHQMAPARTRLEELRLKEQAARLQEAQYAEQLAAAQADLDALPAELAAWGRASTLPGEIDRLQQAILGLGAVNLAALDELAAARERKAFLDKQAEDLVEAAQTLEAAIRRIDRETRSLLQQTFDEVNAHFGRLFPALFGGGQARLVLTGEEILDAGVQVIAQPPGKRNTSIHLLSGGEKALTALSLVFAIFQLNPAPFCLLDEVDAPLDDTNTERFCGMVREMSKVTQFLYISHNKISMEMAHQLIGITMPEPGVSRVVAVDIAEAARIAEPVLA